jgi:hypothetical protein
MACLAAAPASADQWDELAQKIVDQEHARLVRRASDNDGIVIVMEHPLVTQRLVLVVMDNTPGISFQFKSSALPDDNAFELMGRGGKIVTGKDANLLVRTLHRCFETAQAKDNGVELVSLNGLSVSCVVPHDGGGSNFLIASDAKR